MISVEDLLERARAAGVAVYLDADGRLAVNLPDDTSAEIDAVMDELAARAAEVKAHLTAPWALSPAAPPPSRPADLVGQVSARLRAGRAVRIATAYGDVVLAPHLDAARWAEAHWPGVPVFLPYEGRLVAACENRDEVAMIVMAKRRMGARLMPTPDADGAADS